MEGAGICPNCFDACTGRKCPHCGFDVAAYAPNAGHLPVGAVLHDRYIVGRVLGSGGFGITYLAMDTKEGIRRAVKEYFPAMLVYRDPESMAVRPSGQANDAVLRHGLTVFMGEARVLGSFLGDPAIVQVTDDFHENGTAYFAMEFLDGVNLSVLARSAGGSLSLDYGLHILRAVAEALESVHGKGLLHRDVSPENILVTRESRVTLIDFGATRLFVGEQSRSLSVVLKPGFAPPEQYSSKGKQGPWTDVYALCATFYALLSGRRVPAAPDRLGGDPLPPIAQRVPGLSAQIAAAIDQGLSLDYRKRQQSMRAFCRALEPAERKPAEQTVSGPAVQGLSGKPYLQLIRNGALADRWDIPPDVPIKIGRSGGVSNIIVSGDNVSRVHCVVQYLRAENRFALADESVNGTLLPGGQRCEKGRVYLLSPGEVIFVLSRDLPLVLGVEYAR